MPTKQRRNFSCAELMISRCSLAGLFEQYLVANYGEYLRSAVAGFCIWDWEVAGSSLTGCTEQDTLSSVYCWVLVQPMRRPDMTENGWLLYKASTCQSKPTHTDTYFNANRTKDQPDSVQTYLSKLLIGDSGVEICPHSSDNSTSKSGGL